MTKNTSPRALDHLVLPVSNIDVARERYQALGFTVAPDGRHPFGTENCCIFLEDGTFLEPLGIAHRETCEAQALKGQTFVRNDQAFRFRRGDEGFSHLVVRSPDAKADHQLYRSEGISGGKMVRFSRSFETPAGAKAKASFHLAFAADQRSPDTHFFACECVDIPDIDRSALLAHENGAVRLNEVLLSEVNPTDFQYFLQIYLNQRETSVDSFGMSFETANGAVSVLSPDGLKAFYGLESERIERGMRFQAFVLGVRSLERAGAVLTGNDVAYSTFREKIVVPPASGQGTTLILEDLT